MAVGRRFEIEPFVEAVPGSSANCTPGFEGWLVRATSAGRTPRVIPTSSSDMAADGVDAQLLHPNLSQFGLFTDHHDVDRTPASTTTT
jgi:hypothetical protein